MIFVILCFNSKLKIRVVLLAKLLLHLYDVQYPETHVQSRRRALQIRIESRQRVIIVRI